MSEPKLHVYPSPEIGKIVISIVRDSVQLAAVEIEGAEASSAVVAILETAKLAVDLVGRKYPEPDENTKARYSNAVPSSINLGPSHIPGCTSLILAFGETILGVSLPDQELRPFGEKLIAAGAQGAAH